jgi:hypothetical protein
MSYTVRNQANIRRSPCWSFETVSGVHDDSRCEQRCKLVLVSLSDSPRGGVALTESSPDKNGGTFAWQRSEGGKFDDL